MAMKKILFLFLFVFSLTSLHAQRGRVQIQDGTVVTDKGSLLRGVLDRNYYLDFAWEEHKQNIKSIKEYGLNCVHMYMNGPDVSSPEENQTYYDSIVNWTREDSLYLVLTPSWKIGDDGYDIEFIREFWKYYANRYKDETHLIFEIANEPQLYNAPYDSLTLEMHRSVYDTIRRYAPETHIMLMSYAFNINADSAVMDIQKLGTGIDWSNASISGHGYVYSAEATRDFIRELQDSGYAVSITECPSVGNGWTTRYLNKAFYRLFEEEFISSLHHIEIKHLVENPYVFKKVIESSNIRWTPDFGTWPESLTEIDYINPYQMIHAGFDDEEVHIHRLTDSMYIYGVENNGCVAFYDLDFEENTDVFSIACSPASANGNIEIHLDSLNGPLAGNCLLPPSGGWYDVGTSSCPVNIPEGIHDIFLLFKCDGPHAAGIFKGIVFVKPGMDPEQPPYNGIPFELPGIIEAEEFDNGIKHISYFDSTAGNEGGMFRYDDVDIEMTGDTTEGFDVGWIEKGEWLEYTVNCSNEQVMDIHFRIACVEPGEKIRIKLNKKILGTVILPDTDGWQSWETVTLDSVLIPEGDNQVLRIEFLDSGFNLNWMKFIERKTDNLNELNNLNQILFYPNPATEQLTINITERAIVMIYSMYGQLIMQQEISEYDNLIPVNHLICGSYIVKIASNTITCSQVLIVE